MTFVALLAVLPLVNGQGGALKGSVGKIGTPYTIGAKGDELVFTLEKAEFATRFFMKDESGFAEEGRRLVLLNYAVQNPGKTDRMFSNQAFAFTVVSPDDENYLCNGLSGNGWAAVHPTRRDRLNMVLKPTQKVRAIAAIQIHPTGPINKLIVQHGEETPVLRYDLRGLVGPQTGAFATNGGKDSLEIGIGEVGKAFDLGPWNVTVESIQDSSDKFEDYLPDDGGKIVVANLLVENASMIQIPLNPNIILPHMTDAGNDELPYGYVMYKWDLSARFEANMDPGAKAHIKVLFRAKTEKTVPAAMTLKDQQFSGRVVKVQLGK